MIKISFIVLFSFICLQSCSELKLKVVNEPSIKRGSLDNTNNPQILYWFITEESFVDKQYLKDLEYIANKTPFDLVMLTQRKTVSFYDYEKMRPIFKELVERAHELGIKVALQLWPKTFDAPENKSQGIVVEKEIDIAGKSSINYTGKSKHVRYAEDVLLRTTDNEKAQYGPHPLFASPPLYSNLLSAYIFKKLEDGKYVEGTMQKVPKEWITAKKTNGDEISMLIKIPEKYSNYTLYINTVHYHQYGDLFSDYFPRLFTDTFNQYKNISFDGGGIDEFKYMPISRLKKGELFRERMYSKTMADYCLETTGQKLEDVLFHMRYAPEKKSSIRAIAINNYFEILRQGPLKVEKSFYKIVKNKYGKEAFVGVHNTFHNALDNDEIWATGVNWWSVPRDYGQTDERTIYPVRMGVACANKNPVTYNMYYSKDAEKYYDEAIYAARYNVRVHYHAFNDLSGWGLDFKDEAFNKNINRIESCLELLDQFNPPYPKMDLLIVFGFPEQTNWFPNKEQRGAFDVKSNLKILDRAKEIWDSGYTCALAPSYEISSGKISLGDENKINYGGKQFSALVYLNPEYLKEDNLVFLEKFVNDKGLLMLDGRATMGFNGKDISSRFEAIKDKAAIKAFSIDTIEKLGIKKSDLEYGTRYMDNSIVLTDKESILNKKVKVFTFAIDSDAYEATCGGFFALKMNSNGTVDKLAANNFQNLTKNGKIILKLDKPSSVVISSDNKGNTFLVEDQNINNQIYQLQ